MPDVTVSYDEMQSAAGKLDNARTDITTQLQSLSRMINQLVGGPFKTQSASPKFQQSYDEWNSGATKAIEGLNGMTSFLRNAIQGHQELDSNLTQGLSSGQ